MSSTLTRRVLPSVFRALREYIDTQISTWGADTGDLKQNAGPTIPSGWVLSTGGAAISRTTYAGLFALIGTTYGVGDGSTTFNPPNVPAVAGIPFIIKT